MSAAHLAAMEEGFREAGFANVRARNGDEYGQMIVKGDCPCGLGTSCCSVTGDLYRNMAAAYLKHHVKRMGLAHIEEDKAEGRWTP